MLTSLLIAPAGRVGSQTSGGGVPVSFHTCLPFSNASFFLCEYVVLVVSGASRSTMLPRTFSVVVPSVVTAGIQSLTHTPHSQPFAE
jgi:hypothetical protein